MCQASQDGVESRVIRREPPGLLQSSSLTLDVAGAGVGHGEGEELGGPVLGVDDHAKRALQVLNRISWTVDHNRVQSARSVDLPSVTAETVDLGERSTNRADQSAGAAPDSRALVSAQA